MRIIFKFFILFLILIPTSYSQENFKYDIQGNQRISDQTIISIIDFKSNKKYNINDLNNFQKKLYIHQRYKRNKL